MDCVFSPCRRYRYTLWRSWDASKSYVNFICLNPSTADELKDDNTIRKCVKFAKSWGYGAMCVTNLFGWRSTDPKAMKAEPFPIGDENDFHIGEVAKHAGLVIAAWSQHGNHLGRSVAVKSLINSELHYLKMGKHEPYHPLYLPDSTTPILWRENMSEDRICRCGHENSDHKHRFEEGRPTGKFPCQGYGCVCGVFEVIDWDESDANHEAFVDYQRSIKT